MRHIVLHLSLITHVGPLVIKRVLGFLAQQGLDHAWLYRATADDLYAMGVSPTQAEHILTGLRDHQMLEEEFKLLEKHSISLLLENDSAYPSWLRAIHAPPAVLYVQGSCEALRDRNFLAIVGSRQANTYGRSVVEALVPPAVAAGWSIVSGGARGIDACAHRSTLQQSGSTVAILGSGLLRPYPTEHASLFSEIAEKGGAVISPFPLRMTALPGNFPARNRIIAGMSQSCIVVQAAEKSGALITAAYALAEGRDVGIVPGSIFDPLSAGCHRLLRDGAMPIVSRDELMVFLKSDTKAAPEVQQNILAAQAQPEIQPKQPLADNSSRAVRSDKNEDSIVVACTSLARPFDELLPLVGGCSDELYRRLWDLQLQGKITQTLTGLWQAQ